MVLGHLSHMHADILSYPVQSRRQYGRKHSCFPQHCLCMSCIILSERCWSMVVLHRLLLGFDRRYFSLNGVNFQAPRIKMAQWRHVRHGGNCACYSTTRKGCRKPRRAAPWQLHLDGHRSILLAHNIICCSLKLIIARDGCTAASTLDTALRENPPPPPIEKNPACKIGRNQAFPWHDRCACVLRHLAVDRYP